MNPQLHDEFVALCALFYSGEITDEEWALLQVHLAYCDECREHFEQYREMHSGVLPMMASAAAAESAAPAESPAALAAAEQKLLRHLQTVPRSEELRPRNHVRSGIWIALAACVGGLVVFASLQLLRNKSAPASPPVSTVAVAPVNSTPTDNHVAVISHAVGEDQAEIATLRHQIAELREQATLATSSEARLRVQLAEEHGEREQIAANQTALNAQLAGAQSQIASLQGKLASTEAAAADQSSQVATLEAKLRTLNSALGDANTALDDKDRMLSLDKDLLAHDRDIRDVMGARNLYIADIFDTTESGKPAKPFGRIFYTRDRSLIFYGFDLEKQPGLKQDVAFQAWGSGADRQPVSLGLFYQDDGHRRWVLRCEDAKTLARLNMVFVTVEPPGGSNHPTGKQLLRAYLQIPANHP